MRFSSADQQIWEECSRLITNCIIHYNASLLSGMMAYKEDYELFKRISPVAWQHINLFGRYLFSENPEIVNIDQVVQELIQAGWGTHKVA